jgi:predicted RNase H-like nuclease
VLFGIDGCKGGWYVVQSSFTGDDIQAAVHARFADVLAIAPHGSVIAIDIPIGLRAAGSRACDRAARRALAPGRSASVFPAPLRAVLASGSHREASAICRGIEGKGMSIQSFAITRKVAEVDHALHAAPSRSEAAFEVHPELCFAALNGGTPLRFPKKTSGGREERASLLGCEFGDTPSRLVAERSRKAAGADDVLDALACLWTARRIHDGVSQSLPAVPERDERGRRMAIFY